MAAPTLDSTLPHTPAREWASITADALKTDKPNPDNVKTEQPPFVSRPETGETKPTSLPDQTKPALGNEQSAVSTPGHDFPGAYPRSADKGAPNASETLPSVEEVKGVTNSAVDVALSYLPAQDSFAGVVEQAKAYLPQAVQGYFPATQGTETHPVSLPSQEVHGDTSGTSDGVGPLPGSINEAAVAKLPDERTSQEKLPLSEHPIVTTTNALQDQPLSGHTPGHAVTAKDDKIVDSPVNNDGGSPVSTLPTAPVRELSTIAESGHHDHDPSVTTAVTKPTNSAHVVEDKPLPTLKPDPRLNTTNIKGSLSKPDSAGTGDSSASSDPSPKTKASLMEKIKGEAKVISGKMSHNEEKVAEGKKLMGKV